MSKEFGWTNKNSFSSLRKSNLPFLKKEYCFWVNGFVKQRRKLVAKFVFFLLLNKKSFSANGRKSKSKIIFANGRKAFSPDLDEKICCAEWFWLRYSSIFSYFVFVAENVFEELHQSELLFLAENHFRQRRKRLLDSVWKEYQQFIIFVWASNEND